MDYRNNNAEPASELKADTLHTSIERFDSIVSRLDTYVSRLSTCGDLVVGPRPQLAQLADTDKTSPPPPQHMIAQLKSRYQRLARALDRLESELTRLEGGIG